MQLPLAVVLLNYNGLCWLHRFLAAVIKYSPSRSIYVIDNASTDDSLDYLREQLPVDRIIQLSVNRGYAGGYNEGLQQIEARYYVLLNTDISVEEGWWQPLFEWMESRPQVAACQPKLITYDEAAEAPKKFDYAGAAGGLLDPLGYPYCRGRIFSHIEYDYGKYDEAPFRCDWASGACCMLRASAFWEVGGFDTRFFMHMEEIDLCWRLSRAGYRIYCCPKAEVAHIGGGSLPSSSSQKIFLNFRNSLLLLQKQHSSCRLYVRLLLRTSLDAAALLYFCTQGRFLSALALLRAHLSFYKMWSTCPSLSEASSSALPYPRYSLYIVYAYFIKKQRYFSELALPADSSKKKAHKEKKNCKRTLF